MRKVVEVVRGAGLAPITRVLAPRRLSVMSVRKTLEPLVPSLQNPTTAHGAGAELAVGG